MSAIYLVTLFALVCLRTVARIMTSRAESRERCADGRVKTLHIQLANTEVPSLRVGRDFRAEARQAQQVQELGAAMTHADRCAARWLRWDSRRQWLDAAVAWVSGLRGRATPYVAGILDAASVMVGLNQISLATGQTIPDLLRDALSLVTG